MKVVQLIPVLSRGDAVGDECIAIHEMLLRAGYDACIVTERTIRNPQVEVKGIEFLDTLEDDDVVILHFLIGSFCNKRFAFLTCKRGIIYHNVTPPKWFVPYSERLTDSCRIGVDQIRVLADRVDFCITDSEYNRLDLMSKGFGCPITVVPILCQLDDFKRPASAQVLERYGDMPGTNILFTGRVAPNKCHEDILRAFKVYKERYDKDARLFLAGEFSPTDGYCAALLRYIEDLDVYDVIIPGYSSFNDIIAFYQLADVFLCQSEHEGFCVPLVEAMNFDIPIVAYASCAVPGTLGGSGVLLEEKDPEITAGIIDRIMNDGQLREQVIAGQRQRLEDFAYDKVSDQLFNALCGYLEA